MSREQQPDKSQDSGQKHQEARLEVIPAEDRALPHREVPDWTKSRATTQCGWCGYKTQAREHVSKNSPEWRPQQKDLWAEVREETGVGRD